MSLSRYQNVVPVPETGSMHEDSERCVRAVQSKDARFDGWFFTAVLDDRHLLPAELPGGAAQAREHALLPQRRRGPAGGVPGVQALPARRQPRLTRVGRAGRPGRPGDAPDRRRGDGRRRRAGPRPPAGLQRPPGRAAAARRARRGPARAGPGAARADRAAADRDDRAADGRRRVRGRIRQHPDLQRHRAGRVRAVPDASCASRVGARHRPTPRPERCRLRLPFRAPLHPDNLFGHLAATAVPGVEEWREGAYRRTLRLPHGPRHRRSAARPPTMSPAS